MNLTLREPIIHVGQRPFDFCVVTPFSTLARYAEEAARAMHMRTCIAVSDFDNDVEVALEIIRTEKVKLLATRGHAVHILRNKTSVPVLSIGYSSENFFETLLPYQNSGLRVGHICFPEQGLNFMKVAQLLGLTGYRLEVDDRNNILAALQSAHEKKIALLVGGYGLTSKARERGYQAIPLLSENKEAVYQVFTEAKYITAMDSINSNRQFFINTVLNINPNIIVVIDDNHLIKYVNDRAAKAFAQVSPDLIGLHFDKIFPNTNFSQLFSDKKIKKEAMILTDVLNREFVPTTVNISLPHSFEGLVLSLSTVVEIQKTERKVRQDIYGKNTRPLFTIHDIIGTSPCMTQARQTALRFADTDNPVLLVGDTGTGKEMFAQAIHAHSKRRLSPLICVNCASLPEHLLESELFGYEEGAFTGARRGGKAGLFELAHSGTLFFDEVGEMPLPIQSRLLRVLQDKMVMRLGSTRSIPVDVRIICATNRNIFAMVGDKSFREDLFYRINTLVLKVPPLKERREDIKQIIYAYLDKLREEKSLCVDLDPAALQKLEQHTWNGNVRELLHIIDRAIVQKNGNVITEQDILFDTDIFTKNSTPAPAPCRDTEQTPEYKALHTALVNNQYNKGKAAAALGISRATLWRKMKHYGF